MAAKKMVAQSSNNRCGIGPLADFVLDLSTRQPELLFDEDVGDRRGCR